MHMGQNYKSHIQP